MGCDYLVDKDGEFVIVEISDYDTGEILERVKIPTKKFNPPDNFEKGRMNFEVSGAKQR